ncbi:MAG: LysM peptidoglycan-binding domain-containing protein [Lachnospiraceae bacterium]|nr:LysM peptidoglycan-binding domain-containing protein [Lachnospiraceae bacterium]
MIEIIYDSGKEKEGQNNTHQENADNKKIENIGLKLPKNIRQIGNPSGNKRIYIEDYVITYLNFIARPGSTQARGAILLGDVKRSDVGDIIFISGAVDAQNIELDMDETEFSQEIWADIYEQIKENFPELSVVGWFLSRMGFSTAINDKIEKIHVENFAGSNKVLYITDSLESEDAFYMFENGQLVKQKGYFVYYTKNEPMQNYIIKQRGGSSNEKDTEIHRKDAELIKNYRQKNANNSKNKDSKETSGISLLYVASSFVVLAMLAMGITVISSYDKMKDMEVSINRLEITATEEKADTSGAAEAMSDGVATLIDAGDDNISTEIVSTTESLVTEAEISEEVTENTEEMVTEIVEVDEDEISTEQTLPAMNDNSPEYYTVEYGDTLSSIAYERYGSIEYAINIAEANGIDYEAKIYEGQRILLPNIQ